MKTNNFNQTKKEIERMENSIDRLITTAEEMDVQYVYTDFAGCNTEFDIIDDSDFSSEASSYNEYKQNGCVS